MQIEFWAWVRWAIVALPLFYLLFQSRQWTEPARAVRLEAVEDDIKVLRGNFHRLERDIEDWRRQMMDTNEQILRRLNEIQASGAKQHPLGEEVAEIRDRVLDLEQAIHGLPCSQTKCLTP